MSAGTNVAFNTNSLQTFDGTHGILSQVINHAGQITVLAQDYPVSHANNSVIPNVNYPKRVVTLSGVIIGSSISDCDTLIDTFNSYLTAQGANLDIDYAGSTRRYIATPITSAQIDRPGGLAFANFTVSFLCTQAFGQNVNSTTIVNATARTASAYQDVFTFTGSAPIQMPVYTITFTAITTPLAQVSIGNDATGQTLSIYRTWTAGDVLVVNTLTNTVTVNGVPTDYSGAFPTFAPGSQTIDYSDGFTARTINYNVIYYPMYV